MAQKIGWTLGVTVPSGPQLRLTRSVEVEAYDLIKVVVTKDSTDQSVEVQPGGAGKVKFLVILASRYQDVTFKVNSSAADAKQVTLDQPQVLVGDGAVALLDAAPKQLFVTNASATDDVAIEILVGRNS